MDTQVLSRDQFSNKSKELSQNGTQRFVQYSNEQFSGRIKSAVSLSQNQDTKSAKEEYKRKQKEKAEQENLNLWQHPFVDVFKHFKVMPASDWKLNKKQGEVEEYFAKEIGRRAFQIEGTISANNYIQIPHPNSILKTLGLTGRYIYFQVKCPRHGLPFSYHLDLGIAERSHGIRISISNLFKQFGSSNGFVAQVPLELKNNCWTVAIFDIYEILKKSQLLPSTYIIDGCYQIRSINVCANTHVRGIYTSENLYDFITLPADMRYKFAFDLSKWPEYFNWQQLPQDWKTKKEGNQTVQRDENMNLQNLIELQKGNLNISSSEEQRQQIKYEINNEFDQGRVRNDDNNMSEFDESRKQKYDDTQRQLNMQFNPGQGDHPVNGYIVQDEFNQRAKRSKSFGTGRSSDQRGGQYKQNDQSKSHKLIKDPIMELKHIIGYQADKCHQIKWSRIDGENVVIFTSGGTLIAMDTELNTQKRFFFGHSAPICCFDINKQGTMIASAQEQQGKNSIIRVWDYQTARCITMMTMPVVSMKQLSFSYDGRYLVSVGKAHYFMRDKKDPHNKELIIIWDVSKVNRGEKPEIISKQTSDYNILDLKFSPIDSTKLSSCGFENIRFWRIKDTGNIRGSTVVLNNYARNTVFTCLDFEYGFRSADKNENESLKRIFVGSKHGMIFQVNYQSETLEATYKTNDGAIFDLAVNDAFCVIGSEDTYLRVWPLDFSEFFTEAQHEGTVCSVDISNDGLKVACGTLYGSIGILDKANQTYKSLLRSHIDEIISIDFHLLKGILITISKDKTIRLWDLETFEERHEFTSPEDQPLSISSHPILPIFACGFDNGKMRIFDLDTSQISDEFSQFNKPLKSLKYDNQGKFLIACSSDGSVCIHNSERQHLPIKMMHLEMPPEFVHIAFTERLNNGFENQRQRFGIMGEYGNNVILYDTESFLVQNQIMVMSIVKQFQFANNNNDLLVVTKDCKIKFYSLMKYEGIFLREIANCHRGSISGLDVSQNSGYFITGGQDNILKIWDYEAQQTVPFYFQSFIGHTYPITAVIFNPKNNSQIISVSERDGIFIWEFNGDIDTEYNSETLAGQDFLNEKQVDDKNPSMLEKIRNLNKAKKEFRNQMKEDSFFIPQFKAIQQCNIDQNYQEFIDSPIQVKQQRIDKKLTYNHYANCSKKIKTDIESGSIQSIIEQKLINGYDGFGGVHDNLIWNSSGGLTFFTLNNKFIIEETQTRKQYIFSDSTVQLSCIVASEDFKMIAVAEGSENQQSKCSLVYLYDVEKRKLFKKLTFHLQGVQSMAFTQDGRYLITVGVKDENNIAIFDVNQGIVVKNSLIKKNWSNYVKVDFSAGPSHIQFVTVGNNASLIIWRFDIYNHVLENFEVAAPDSMANVNFLTCDFTQMLPEPISTYLIVIGCDNGSLIAYDQKKNEYVDLNSSRKIIDGQIGIISIKNNMIVIGSSKGIIQRYPINNRSSIQPEDYDMQEKFDCNSAIVSISMDELNNEGLVGTEAGEVYFINFDEKLDTIELPVKLISSINKQQDSINYIKFDPEYSSLFVTSCGKKSDDLKIYTVENCDELRRFQGNYAEEGYVVFVISFQNSGQQGQNQKLKNKRVIGFSNGYIKRANFKNIEIENVFKLPLNQNEILTCGFYCENGYNILIGTNQGTLFIISLNEGKGKKKKVDANFVRIDNIGKFNNFDTEQKQIKFHTNLNSDIIDDEEINDIDRGFSQQDLMEYTGITMIRTPFIDPIGTILISFDDGSIKVWQSSKNDQVIKILELQQAMQIKKSKEDPKLQNQSASGKPALYDIADFGYQQFDLIDNFDLFKVQIDEDQNEFDSKLKFKGKKYQSCQAQFSPSTSRTEQYFCLVDALQFIFIRDYKNKEVIKKIAINNFPSCMVLLEFNKLALSEDSYLKQQVGNLKGNILGVIGTLEGKILLYKFGNQQNKLYNSKVGVSFGGITAIDIMIDGNQIIAATETGEIIIYDLLQKLNE